MSRRRIILASALALAGLATYALSRVLAEPVPVDVIGPHPKGYFVSKGATYGKPVINLALPGGAKIIYPRKYPIANPSVDPLFVCGYWKWPDPVGDISIGTSNPVYPVYQEQGDLIDMPFATDPNHREAVLHAGGREQRFRLPYSSRFGPAERRTSRVRVGDVVLQAIPEPWRISTAPIELTFTVKPIRPQEMVTVMIGGSLDFLDGQYEAFLASPGASSLESFTLAEGETFSLNVLPHDTPILRGGLCKLTQKPITLRARQTSAGWQLLMPDGTCVYGDGSKSIRKYAFQAMRIFHPKWHPSGVSIIPDEIEKGSSETMTDSVFREGESVPAIGYFLGVQHEFELIIDVPRIKRITPRIGLTAFWEVP